MRETALQLCSSALSVFTRGSWAKSALQHQDKPLLTCSAFDHLFDFHPSTLPGPCPLARLAAVLDNVINPSSAPASFQTPPVNPLPPRP